jgi:CheY-like chemotaxis protein
MFFGMKKDTESANKSLTIKGTILFVDDEHVNLTVGETVLKRLGYKTLTASNGLEAINKYKAQNDEIDLIIMDMNMPIMDGEEAIKAILNFDSNARFIVSSGLLTKSQTRELDSLGITNFLQKPYRANVVDSVIQSALTGKL